MVLLLDNDDDFRLALAANLIDDGHAVAHYARPSEVPSLAAMESVSMLIVDYEMGGEDGLSFADRFHAQHPRVPVVLVTVHRSAFLDRALAARDFITLRNKPVDYAELASLIPLPA